MIYRTQKENRSEIIRYAISQYTRIDAQSMRPRGAFRSRTQSGEILDAPPLFAHRITYDRGAHVAEIPQMRETLGT